jgi:hypothetical protein
MMEFFDAAPAIHVDPAEYARLLGFPRQHVMDGRVQELAHWAQTWYAEHGRPWLYVRQCRSMEVAPGAVTLDGVGFLSPRLEQMLTTSQASGAFLAAVSASPEAEAEAQRLWHLEQPDKYFFLEIYGSAVVEHLVTLAAHRLCAWADRNALAVLPHYSPGYPDWDIDQQSRLLDLIIGAAEQPIPGSIAALDTGMLRPKKSLLAVFGLTPQIDRVRRLTHLIPCENCSLARCDFRRAPYRGSQEAAPEVVAATAGAAQVPAPFQPLALHARYATSTRALERWARERLSLSLQADGTVEALFYCDGTTCSNMGRPLTFHYHVTLGSRAEGYPLRAMRCMPAPGDEGHKFMCRYISHQDVLLAAIDQEKPLLGSPLNDVLAWNRPASGAGCYCEPASRQHKWGLVLETLHYALAQREAAAGSRTAPLEWS